MHGIAARQWSCPSTLQASKSPPSRSGCEVKGVSLLCETATGLLRPLVPVADCQQIFKAIHGVVHPWDLGHEMIDLSMFSVARYEHRHCFLVQRLRGLPVCQGDQAASDIPSAHPHPSWFSHVCVDMVGPLLVSESGFTYLMTMIDRTTR
jgi:hypothetical protein